MKKIFLLFIALLSGMHTWAYICKVDGICYSFYNQTTVKVTYSGYPYNNEYTGHYGTGISGRDIVIPPTISYNDVEYTVTAIGDRAFYDCESDVRMASITIPSTVTSIGNQAFWKCTALTSFTIPSSVTSIGDDAFYGCYNLTELTIPNSVKSIGYEAFEGTAWYKKQLDGLVYAGKVAYKYKGTVPSNTSIKIDEGTLSITGYAFLSCHNLTSITIPNSVTSIGKNAFSNCSDLTEVICYANVVPNTDTSVFDGVNLNNATLYVPAASVASYRATAPWNNFGTIIGVTPKCATPSITIADGKMQFVCETEGVEYIYNFSSKLKSDEDGKGINTPNKLQVSVYAKKDGFENSDVATKEIDLGASGLRGDLNNDGQVGMPDAMFIVNKILNGKFPDEEDDGSSEENNSKAGIRFGFYETIPGYSVKIDKINVEGVSASVIGNNVVGSVLKQTKSQPTWGKTDGNYSFIDSGKNNDNPMVIKLEYILTSEDGSGETIAVKDAEVTVPTRYIQWEVNKNYTYIIKIKDNTNTYIWGDTTTSDIYPASLDSVIIDNNVEYDGSATR